MAKEQSGGFRREGGYRTERKDSWKGRDFRGDSGDGRDRRNFRGSQERRDRQERWDDRPFSRERRDSRDNGFRGRRDDNSRPDRDRQERRPFREERPWQLELKVQRWGINGEGIGYYNRKPVFIPAAVPGETVLVEVEKELPKFMTARLVEVREASPRRQQPPCEHYRECGGCSLIHVDYKGQMQMKKQFLEESLKKYAGYTGGTEPMIKNPTVFEYRNSCKMPAAMVDDVLETGLYKRDTNEFVPVRSCAIHSRVLEKVRREVMDILREGEMKAWSRNKRGGLRMLVMKEFDGRVQVILVTDPMDVDPEITARIMNIPEVASIWQSIKTERDPEVETFGKVMRHLAGDETLSLKLGDFDLSLLPRSFFQLNTAQAKVLYDTVRDMTPQGDLIVEAYSGIGGISMFVHDKAGRIIGIEDVADAVENARENAKANGLENVEFIKGDAAEQLEEIADNEDVDTLIVDPPRSGLQDRMIEAVKFAQPKHIVYVSCNPSTLAKDIEALEDYEIEKVQPVDIFSQTSNVEAVVKLKRTED
ncbi:23S rRNA (uracil(1939)-C(5))-methyltransferase RlmD [uncultured Faecalibaculum sp.]|uniref:23S rRNA (uracil(1939)-C(5))-methyltransferase RlmD n=1 Tax=uncultured Faecalibaculum sp. TaxID=1729681 RepID=UPI00260C6E2E|nr:23S rRNA (uracil(1939)-C(5))-methyltransferase RlmD [uncultured Faecalibaculum sp.]